MEFLFDTSYLLPFLSIPINVGITSKTYSNQLKTVISNPEIVIHISSCSIIECQWKAIRLFNKYNNPRFLKQLSIALPMLSSGEDFSVINPWEDEEILNLSNELLLEGHQDYMDCLIFATALKKEIPIVTEEKKLVKRLNKIEGWSSLTVYNWISFYKSLH